MFQKIPVENAFRKIRKIFKKKKCFRKTETVPKWNDLERILLPLERFPSILERFLLFQISYIFGHIVDHQQIDS